MNMDKSELNVNWESLGSKEREILIIMLTSSSDSEAISRCPVGKTRYYQLKKRLSPIREQLAIEVGRKALETIRGSSLEAANTLVKLLNSRNENIKVKAAEQILDRVLGTSQKQFAERPNITILGIRGISDEDLNKLTQPPEKNGIVEDAEIMYEN